MASEVASLAVRIGADISGLTKGLDESQNRLEKFKKIGTAAGTGLVAIGAAAVTAGAAMAALAMRSAAVVDAQADMAAQLGASYAALNTLTMAAKNAGVEATTVTGAILKLNDGIGNLSSGAGGPAAKALTALGLSADQLSKMDADQKVSAVVGAIRDTVPVAQQASVAIDLFGKTAGAAMMQLNPDRIADAAEQARVFGLNLSAVDTERIGAIGDALDLAGAAMQGLGGQLANQFAPIVRQISIDLYGAAGASAGFGTIAANAFAGVIKTVGFLASAVDLLARPFIIVGNTIYGTIIGMILNPITDAIRGLATLANKIPGVDLSGLVASLDAEVAHQKRAFNAAGQRITDALVEPLAGNAFDKWAEDAVIQAELAASKAAAGMKAARESSVTPESAPQATATSAAEEAAEQFAIQVASNDVRIAEEQRAADEIDMILDESLANMKRREEEKVAYAEWSKKAQGSILSNLSTLMNGQSRKMFEVGKAASLAQAIINTATGATRALAEGGPFLGPALAASIVAAGMAQVKTIRAQTFNGGGGGASAPSNTAAVNAAATPTGGGGQGGGNASSAPQTLVNVTLKGDVFGRDQVVGLVDKIRQLQAEGSVVSFA